MVYYNELDPYAAQYLRNLIAAGHIADGWVDERSIEDVRPCEIEGFIQHHFFAGVGVWSLALRRAGWPDTRPVWSASCPCQPFSASGQRAGFTDKRHLWPALEWLVRELRPTVLIGEQVAGKDAGPWVDLVQTDLEAMDYAFGCVPFPSAGVGAPHIRDRAYWVAHSGSEGLAERVGDGRVQREAMGARPGQTAVGGGHVGGLADARRLPGAQGRTVDGRRRQGSDAQPWPRPGCGGLPDSGRVDAPELRLRSDIDDRGPVGPMRELRECVEQRERNLPGAGPTNGYWSAADWIFCRDGKWRPIEPCTFPLANGAPARVGRLCAYGNAVNVEAARVWIESVMECI